MHLYIPIWYNSSKASDTLAPLVAFLYIPIWYNSSNTRSRKWTGVRLLYIPIWYNSSASETQEKKFSACFTFQSGTIQADSTSPTFGALSIFTFQSGTIQAKTGGSDSEIFQNFTFQSGTIQALIEKKKPEYMSPLHSNLVQFKRQSELWERDRLLSFTFQSGTIQALGIGAFGLLFALLYIPIWYNSSPPNCGVLFPMFSTPVSVYHDHIVNKNPFPVPFPNYRKRIFIGVFNPCRPRCIFTLS